MSDDDRKQRAQQRRVETARELEGRGFVDHAVKEYLRAKAPQEAARLLASKGRLKDAGQAILDGLKVDAASVGRLDAEGRALAGQAATFFAQGNEPATAAAIQAALEAAPPVPPPKSAPSTSAPEAPSSPPAASPLPAGSSSPARPSGFRRPGAAPSGSFRPPAGSFRPPAGSFRPPAGPGVRVPSAPPGAAGSTSSRPPAAAKSSAPPVVVTPSPPGPEPRKAMRPPSGLEEPQVVKETAAKETAAKLSASGDVVTEYSGSREAGWRGAGDASIDLSIQEHLDAGRKGTAARIARDAGRYEQALEWFREAGLVMQAGACLRALGRLDEALETLLSEEIGGGSYRKACFELVPIAKELGRLDFDIDHFLTGFVDEGPLDRDEIPTYLDLARLYAQADFLRGARRCVTQVLGLDPEHADALALKAELQEARAAAAAPKRKPTSRPAPSSLEGLPPLPSLEEFIALARAHAPA